MEERIIKIYIKAVEKDNNVAVTFETNTKSKGEVNVILSNVLREINLEEFKLHEKTEKKVKKKKSTKLGKSK